MRWGEAGSSETSRPSKGEASLEDLVVVVAVTLEVGTALVLPAATVVELVVVDGGLVLPTDTVVLICVALLQPGRSACSGAPELSDKTSHDGKGRSELGPTNRAQLSGSQEGSCSPPRIW